MDRGVVIGIAGLAGVALSLGFAVALLVAQHTAERHVRLMFAEFRADRTWALTLGSFAVGVGLIVGAGVWQPTLSTAWASVLGLVWLGLLGANAFPRLLDSLDPVVLAERATQRSVRRLTKATSQGLTRPDERLEAEAQRGITACATVAHEALGNDDADVFEAAVRGLASILIAYLRRSPWAVPTDLPIDLAFQRIDVISATVAQRSQVILMPVFIAELKRLGLDAADIAKSNPNGNDPVSLRLNMVLFEVLAASLQNRTSGAPAFAATTIADLGVALVDAGQPNGVRDHIDKLSAVASGGLDVGADHVTAAAIHGLARIAAALLQSDPREVMPPSHFESSCQAIRSVFDRHVQRRDATLQGQISVLPIIGPLAAPSLPTLAVAAVQRATSTKGFSPREFGFGAEDLFAAAATLASAEQESGWIRGTAVACLYSAVVGVLAVAVRDGDSADRIDRWLDLLTRTLLDDEQHGKHKLLHAPETLGSALLLAAYAIHVAAPEVADRLRTRLKAIVDFVGSLPAGFERRRLVRALVPVAAAIVCAEEAGLTSAIARGIGADLRPEIMSGHGRQFTPTTPMLGIPRPRYTDDHQRPEGYDRLLATVNEFTITRRPGRAKATKPRASAAKDHPTAASPSESPIAPTRMTRSPRTTGAQPTKADSTDDSRS